MYSRHFTDPAVLSPEIPYPLAGSVVEERQRRKLAVILHADVVGSTTLVHRNETLAHHRIQDSFRHLSETIKAYGGLTHELRGDALVAEFARASDAVCAALSFQHEHTESLLALSDDIKPTIRIGISLGEVVFADNTVTGGGVVLAQRVEQLAEPGGVCITAAIHEALPQHMPFDQYDLGEQELKGFEEAIRVYRVALKSGQVVPPPEQAEKPKSTNTLGISAAVAAIVLIIAGGLAYWFQPWTVKEEPASVERMAFPLPDKPSIAILPFSDLSDGVEHTYIAEGLTENIIATLGKISGLFVIDRLAVTRYSDGSIKAHQVSEELGVRYILKGSVQKSGDRLRVTTTLVDTSTGRHIWSERYDRNIADLFSVQDEITGQIVVELQVNLTDGEQARLKYDSTTNFDAWTYFIRASKLFNNFTKKDNAKAREHFERAVDLDPRYAVAWSWLAWTHWIDARFGYSESREVSFSRAEVLAAKSIELDPELADALALLGAIHLYQREYDEALDKGRMAVDLTPNNAVNHATVAITTYSVGDWSETIKLLQKAMRLSPYYPSWYLLYLGRAQTFQGDYKEAIATHEKGLARAESPYTKSGFHAALAFAHIETGNEQLAREFMLHTLEVIPHYSASYVKKTNFFKNTNDLERLVGALRKAGMPENPPLKLPDKPSIAVLPFQNLSGDEKQKYFVDGVTEDIITILSRFSELFVIAKRSSFRYRDKDTEIGQIGKELGVQYVLEGSIRRSEDKLIVTVQLIDTATGTNVWTERYQEPLTDIFQVQENILENIVSTVAGRIENMELRLADQKETDNLSAYDLVLRGYAQFPKWTKESFESAREYFHDAIELDPRYARAYAGIGFTHNIDFSRGWGKDPELSLEKAREMSLKAIELDDKDNRPRVVLGWAYINAGDLDKGISEIKKGVSLNPNDANVLARSGYALTYYGEFQQAIDQVKRAMRINPFHPSYYYDVLAWAQYFLNQYDEALKTLENVPEPNIAHLLTLAAASARIGDSDKAQAYAKVILQKNPDFNLDKYRETRPFKYPENIDFHVESLRMAGLP